MADERIGYSKMDFFCTICNNIFSLSTDPNKFSLCTKAFIHTQTSSVKVGKESIDI